MSSPIFDATFGTGRFKHEEPMMTPFTPKEDRMTITDDDLNYLRNINTRPGPNAGRSIDPTKPGPDADRASSEPQDARGLAREAADTISRELAELGVRVPDDLREPIASEIRKAIRTALAQSDAISRSGEREKSPLITDVQEHRDAAYQNGWDDGYAEGYGKAHALAQSDAGPRETYDKIKGHAVRNLEKETSEYANKIEQLTKERDEALDVCERLLKEKAAVTQSDAEPAADEEAADALRSEYKTYARQMDRRWAGVHGELIPDCPTEGVAARQGNGG